MADSKVLFITGASSGIGAETARQAVAAGWKVGLFARSAAKLEKLVADLGEAAVALPGDATNRSDQTLAIDALVDRFGGLDAVFANAGRGVDTPGTAQGDPDEWDGLVDLNIKGLLYTVHAAMPYLRDRRGHVLLTGSQAGRMHLPGSVYGATKWFVHGYAGNLAAEMADWGGRCTVIAPGAVDTPFFDQSDDSRLSAGDVAAAALHALSARPGNNVREIFLSPVSA